MNKFFDVVIIGAGPAGMTAGIYAVRKGLSVLVIGTEIGGQVSKSGEVDNLLGFGFTTGAELTVKFQEHIKKFEKIEHIDAASVTQLRRMDQGFEVVAGAQTVLGRSIIVASGRKPRELGIPGEQEFKHRGVSYCEVCDAPLFKGKKTMVIGGGNSGLEAAYALAELSPEVVIVTNEKDLRGDEVLRAKIRQRSNVQIFVESKPTEIFGKQLVEGVKLQHLASGKVSTVNTQGVFVEIGYVPNVDFDDLTEKDEQHRIKITPECETNVPGVFAAGDVTNIRDNQIIIAAGEGAKAALSCYSYCVRQQH